MAESSTNNSSPEAVFQINLQELVAAIVHALHVNETVKTSNKDISSLLPTFKGDNEDVKMWFQRVEAIRTTYSVSEPQLLLSIVSKLEGTALQWYHSKPEYVSMKYNEFKQEMLKMYAVKEDCITLMKKFEARRWKRGEKFSSYFSDKVILGNKLSLTDETLMMYIMDGFDNPALQLQAKLIEFDSLNHMLTLMKDITQD